MIKTEIMEQILSELKSGNINTKELAKRFNCSRTNIYYIMNRHKIKNNEGRIYKCNDNVFNNINTEEKAYWLGFLMGDGSIYKNRIKLALNQQDLDHIVKFKKFIGYEGTISGPGKDKCYSINITSNQLTNDLSKYGIIPNKTYTKIKTPSIDTCLLRHFYLGLFDADGHFNINTTRKTRKPNPCIGLTSYYPDILEEFKDFIFGNLTKSKICKSYSKTGSAYNFRTSGRLLFLHFGNIMYHNSTIFLERKKQLYDKYLLISNTNL